MEFFLLVLRIYNRCETIYDVSSMFLLYDILITLHDKNLFTLKTSVKSKEIVDKVR